MTRSERIGRSLSWRNNTTRPFFLAYGSFNPHMPWYVPKKYFDMYPLDQIVLPELKDDDLDDLPPLAKAVSDGIGSFADKVIKSGKHKESVQAYLATTTYVDTQMGRVLDALENSPYKDNTIVVFLTDHGFHLGEKHHWQKTTLWEEGTHTLLMFRAPGVTTAGGVSQRFVSLLDIYPTLAELCELTAPATIDGRSLVPLLKDPNGSLAKHGYHRIVRQDQNGPGLCQHSQRTRTLHPLRVQGRRILRHDPGPS